MTWRLQSTKKLGQRASKHGNRAAARDARSAERARQPRHYLAELAARGTGVFLSSGAGSAFKINFLRCSSLLVFAAGSSPGLARSVQG